MKRTITSTALLLCAAMLSLSGCITTESGPKSHHKARPADVTITEADAGHTVVLHAGQTLDLRLQDMAGSTGYTWEDRTKGNLYSDHSVLDKLRVGTSPQERSERGLPAIPNTRIQTYWVRNAGHQDLTWVHIPPGSGTSPKVLTFHIVVKKALDPKAPPSWAL